MWCYTGRGVTRMCGVRRKCGVTRVCGVTRMSGVIPLQQTQDGVVLHWLCPFLSCAGCGVTRGLCYTSNLVTPVVASQVDSSFVVMLHEIMTIDQASLVDSQGTIRQIH